VCGLGVAGLAWPSAFERTRGEGATVVWRGVAGLIGRRVREAVSVPGRDPAIALAGK
jgi:hypothetical protein